MIVVTIRCGINQGLRICNTQVVHQLHINPINIMNYLVCVKRTFDESEYGSDYTFEDAYFQGSEKVFKTEDEAIEYFKSFEDWEQDLLTIGEVPF